MITDRDIKKLKAVFATRDEIDSKFDRVFSIIIKTQQDVSELQNDVGDLRESVQGLYVANDGLAKTLAEIQMEFAAYKGQTNRRFEQTEKILKIKYT
jgi:hypothetical protein